MQFRFPLAILVYGCSLIGELSPARGASPQDAVLRLLPQSVLPVLESRCVDCHDDEMRKGDISLEPLTLEGQGKLDIRLWAKIREQIRAGTMPPKSKAPLEPAEKRIFLDWIGQNELAMLALPPTDPGTRKTRRLTREEYSNTLRDLLGISSRPGDKFPADGAGGEGFSNNADTLTFSPLLIEKFLGGAEQALAEVWSKPELKGRLLAPVTSDKLPPTVGAELALRPYLRRAYRRPVSEQEVQQVLNVFNEALKRGRNWDQALQAMFKATLTSPKFLFLEEKHREGAKSPWKVEPHEMASRMSYFLWSSMPDDTLFRLADEGRLQNPAILAAEVRRMLLDTRAAAFTKNFAAQWLHFDQLFVSVDPDRRKFTQFTDVLRQSMYDEAFAFSDGIFRRNGRVLDFLDSDYTYLNEPLAKLYEIPGVQGAEMRQVKFTDKRRGGLTGMGAILAVTALPQRTSPVLRGKWVLEQLLSAPPPPPPPNVGDLPEDDRALKDGQTFRQRLEQHRSKPACVGCHVRMDPLGFGLENFNAIGQWRGDENGKPLDASGLMPDGTKFSGPAEMRQVLMKEKDLFLRTLCSRLLGFALNRGLEVEDQPTLLRLEEVLKQNDCRAESLIIALVQSFPFTHRK